MLKMTRHLTPSTSLAGLQGFGDQTETR
jgi:hypothetical protein